MFHAVLDWFAGFWLPGIFFLMALESSLVPVPSEVVLIPAGLLAAQWKYPLMAVILAAGLWSLTGSWISYGIGKFLGKPFLLNYGKYFLVSHKDYHLAEWMFLKNSHVAVFVARFLPVIRHLISIPAGIFAMSPVWFTLLSLVGATLWSAILTLLGYYFGQSALDFMEKYLYETKIAIVLALFALVVWFVWTHLKKRRQ